MTSNVRGRASVEGAREEARLNGLGAGSLGRGQERSEGGGVVVVQAAGAGLGVRGVVVAETTVDLGGVTRELVLHLVSTVWSVRSDRQTYLTSVGALDDTGTLSSTGIGNLDDE